MSAPRKYDQEFRERAVRMYQKRLAEPAESKRSARRHVRLLLDLNPETLLLDRGTGRGRVRPHPGTTVGGVG
jgi:hypothetical protein